MTQQSNASLDWASFSARHSAGDIVHVTVTRTLPFGCLVEAGDGVSAAPRELPLSTSPRILSGRPTTTVRCRVSGRAESVPRRPRVAVGDRRSRDRGTA
jgi:hypothetical protein